MGGARKLFSPSSWLRGSPSPGRRRPPAEAGGEGGGYAAAESEARAGRAGLLTLGLVGMSDAVQYSVVMPGLFRYATALGGSAWFYGLILAAPSAVSVALKPVIGLLGDKLGFRWTFLLTFVLSLLGNLLYLSAAWLDALYVLLVARVLCGIGGSNSVLTFAFVGRTTHGSKRTEAMSFMSAARMLGLATGPAWNLLLELGPVTLLGRFQVDNVNGAGAIGVVLIAVSAALVLATLREPAPFKEAGEEGERGSVGECLRRLLRRPRAWLCFLVIFYFNFAFTGMEAALAPIGQHALGWNTAQVSATYTALSVGVLAASLLCAKAAGIFSNEALQTFGLAASCSGYFLLVGVLWRVPMPGWAFVGPPVFTSFAFPFMSAANRALFTLEIDLIGAGHFQGFLQGMLSVLSSLGGTLGPLFSAPNIVLPEHPSGGRALAAPMLLLPVLGLAALLFGLALWFRTGALTEPDGADAAPDELTQGLLVANELMDEEEAMLCETPMLVRRFSLSSANLSPGTLPMVIPSSPDLGGALFSPRSSLRGQSPLAARPRLHFAPTPQQPA